MQADENTRYWLMQPLGHLEHALPSNAGLIYGVSQDYFDDDDGHREKAERQRLDKMERQRFARIERMKAFQARTEIQEDKVRP